MFLHLSVSHSLHRVGMCGGGHAWWGGMDGGGHVCWGVCMAGACMVGVHVAGGHAWQGACVAGGHACHTHPPADTMRYGDMVNEQAVCILLECILVLVKGLPLTGIEPGTHDSGVRLS